MRWTRVDKRSFIGDSFCLSLMIRGGQEHVSPWRWFVHVYQNPHLLGSFLATLEESQNIFVAVVVMQSELDSAINDFGISCGGIIIPEQAGVRRDSKTALTEHHKGTQCRDSIRVEVEQLAAQIAHDDYQELVGWKSQFGNQMRLEADYGGALNSGNVYFRIGGNYVTSESATLMVGLTLVVSDGRLLEEVL
jgi:hypothetical protein